MRQTLFTTETDKNAICRRVVQKKNKTPKPSRNVEEQQLSLTGATNKHNNNYTYENCDNHRNIGGSDGIRDGDGNNSENDRYDRLISTNIDWTQLSGSVTRFAEKCDFLDVTNNQNRVYDEECYGGGYATEQHGWPSYNSFNDPANLRRLVVPDNITSKMSEFRNSLDWMGVNRLKFPPDNRPDDDVSLRAYTFTRWPFKHSIGSAEYCDGDCNVAYNENGNVCAAMGRNCYATNLQFYTLSDGTAEDSRDSNNGNTTGTSNSGDEGKRGVVNCDNAKSDSATALLVADNAPPPPLSPLPLPPPTTMTTATKFSADDGRDCNSCWRRQEARLLRGHRKARMVMARLMRLVDKQSFYFVVYKQKFRRDYPNTMHAMMETLRRNNCEQLPCVILAKFKTRVDNVKRFADKRQFWSKTFESRFFGKRVETVALIASRSLYRRIEYKTDFADSNNFVIDVRFYRRTNRPAGIYPASDWPLATTVADEHQRIVIKNNNNNNVVDDNNEYESLNEYNSEEEEEEEENNDDYADDNVDNPTVKDFQTLQQQQQQQQQLQQTETHVLSKHNVTVNEIPTYTMVNSNQDYTFDEDYRDGATPLLLNDDAVYSSDAVRLAAAERVVISPTAPSIEDLKNDGWRAATMSPPPLLSPKSSGNVSPPPDYHTAMLLTEQAATVSVCVR